MGLGLRKGGHHERVLLALTTVKYSEIIRESEHTIPPVSSASSPSLSSSRVRNLNQMTPSLSENEDSAILPFRSLSQVPHTTTSYILAPSLLS